MKQFKFLAAIPIIMAFVLVSCNNSGEEKKADAPSTPDTNKVVAPAPTAEVKHTNIVIMMHKVANYAKWLPVYEAGDSARKASGLKNYVLGRGLGADSNTVMVALVMTDIDKAKAFENSADLKDKMKKAGVISEPTVAMQENVAVDTPAMESKIRVIVTHKVKDWDAWKKEFDSHKQARLDAGLTDRIIGHNIDDTHMVRMSFGVTDLNKAKAFMESKDLKDKMTAAGVEGPPTIFFYTIAKKY